MTEAVRAVKQPDQIAEAEKKLNETRRKKCAEATEFMRVNPNMAFVDVGTRFGFSEYTASKLWKAAGFLARPNGRKRGISPGKRESKA
jgi:hypothetical protein